MSDRLFLQAFLSSTCRALPLALRFLCGRQVLRPAGCCSGGGSMSKESGLIDAPEKALCKGLNARETTKREKIWAGRKCFRLGRCSCSQRAAGAGGLCFRIKIRRWMFRSLAGLSFLVRIGMFCETWTLPDSELFRSALPLSVSLNCLSHSV